MLACKTPPLEGLWIYGLTVLAIILTAAGIRDKVAGVPVAWDSGSVFRIPVLRTVTVTLDLRSSLAVPPLCAIYSCCPVPPKCQLLLLGCNNSKQSTEGISIVDQLMEKDAAAAVDRLVKTQEKVNDK